MPRNKHGFLKSDALKSGIPEQYAVVIHHVTHTVQIKHDDFLYGGFALIYTAVSAHATRKVETWFAADLPAARDGFRAQVRRLGGRA